MSDEPTSRPRGSTVLCWLLILASIGWVAGNVFVQRRAGLGKADNFQLELNSRILIGQKLLLKDLGQPVQPVDQMLRTLDAAATSPEQKLEAAIVAGELAGGEEALKRLESRRSDATTKPSSDAEQTLEKMYSGQLASVTPEERRALIEHHGWFGKLALVYGLPDNDPERARIISPTKRTLLIITGFGLSVLVLVGAGLILLIVAIVLIANGRIRPLFRPNVMPNGPPVFLEAFAIYITTFVVFSEVIHRVFPRGGFVGYLFLSLLIPFALIWPTRRGLSKQESLHAFGWHCGRGFFTEMGCGVAGYIAGLPLIALAFLITLGLSRFAGASPSHPIMNEVRGGWGTVLMIYMLASVWAPLMEETMFRGALYNHLRGRWSWIVSSLVIGLLFALVHPQGWTTIPALGMIGVVLATIREWRGSLIGPMTAHALNNATVTTLLVFLVH
ncbi:MAG: CPBP family intramembrane metalloprotease [Anaerolineae bacterium]|nr:CPBP family intramembrane metalloprotease [Phycisphaerae bacterium]